MKAYLILIVSVAGLLAGCDNTPPGSGGTPPKIGLCPSAASGGGEEVFVPVDQTDLLARVKT